MSPLHHCDFPTGGVGVMCPLTEQGKQLAIQVSNILGMDFCGIDLLIMDDGSFVVCEANANVGFPGLRPGVQLRCGGSICRPTTCPCCPTGRPREDGRPPKACLAPGRRKSQMAVLQLRELWRASMPSAAGLPPASEPELGEIKLPQPAQRGPRC